MKKRVGAVVPGPIPERLMKTVAYCCKCTVSDLDVVYLGYNFADGYEIARAGIREGCEFLVLMTNEKLLRELFYSWNELEYNVLSVPQWRWDKLCSNDNEEQDKIRNSKFGILKRIARWFKNFTAR